MRKEKKVEMELFLRPSPETRNKVCAKVGHVDCRRVMASPTACIASIQTAFKEKRHSKVVVLLRNIVCNASLWLHWHEMVAAYTQL